MLILQIMFYAKKMQVPRYSRNISGEFVQFFVYFFFFFFFFAYLLSPNLGLTPQELTIQMPVGQMPVGGVTVSGPEH